MRIRNYRIFLGIFLFLVALTSSQLLIDRTNLEEAIQLQNLAAKGGHRQDRPILSRYLQRAQAKSDTGQKLVVIQNTNYTKFGLVLNHDIPSSFIQGQIFQVRGHLTAPAIKNGTYISFNFINKANVKQKFTFVTKLDIGETEWKINIDTKTVIIGDYNLALYTGLTGSFNPQPIYTIKAPTPDANKVNRPPAPTECSLALQDNKLIVMWKQETTTPIQRIVFSQNGKTIEYILSNFHSSYEIKHKDFANFTIGTVKVSVSSAYSSTLSLAGRISSYSQAWNYAFYAGPHNFSESHPEIKLSKQIPWTVPFGTTIQIEGEASVILYNGMKVEQPQNVVGTYNLSTINSTTIPPNTYFSRNFTFSKQGVYILQINANTGLAVLNRPVYVETGLPLLPDFEDFLPHSYHQTQIAALIAAQPQTPQGLRNSLLKMINQKRASWGREPLSLDSTLISLAQNHSNDMVARGFFGHMNPSGHGPQDRAKNANLGYTIGENVAKNIDLRQGHERLCRSPGHLQNIINPIYTRVGLGIAKDNKGYLLITENYAAPLPAALLPPPDVTENELQKFRVQVRNWIYQNYQVDEDPALSSVINDWMQLKGAQPLMGYTWKEAKYKAKLLAASTLVLPFSTNPTKKIVKGTHFKLPNSNYTKFGIAVREKEEGMIKVVVQYASD